MPPVPERNRFFRFLSWMFLLVVLGSTGLAADEPAFTLRGYYLTFMRMPAMGLAEWKQAVDCFAKDDMNTLVLWMPGGFRSRKFPLTWPYNEEHPNVRQDFVRELIDYAHASPRVAGVHAVWLRWSESDAARISRMEGEESGWLSWGMSSGTTRGAESCLAQRKRGSSCRSICAK
jgi:hypothetical protein